MNAVVDAEFELITQLIEDITIPCEGRSHARGLYGHDPSEQGEFIICNPCGERCIQCGPRVARMYDDFDIPCHTCGKTHPMTSYLIEPIRKIS